MKTTVLTLAIGTALALTAGAASAQLPETDPLDRGSPPTFESADADGNGEVSKEEFREAIGEAGLYSSIDTDGDGFVDDDELGMLDFASDFAEDHTWDADEDGFVDSGEFYDGVYMGFDRDESGHWDGDEWDAAGEAGFWDI